MVKKKSQKEDVKKTEQHSEKKTINKNFLKNISNNYWAIATIVLTILLIISISAGLKTTGAVIVSPQVAGEKVIEFAQSQGVNSVELISVQEKYSLYEVTLLIEGQEVPVYITFDGKTFVPQPIPLEETQNQVPVQNTQTQQQAQVELSEEEMMGARELMQCLKESGVKVYGADWCGYTKQLVQNLGGYDIIEPIYVECTIEDELCRNEGIQGYPTIKINGEQVNIERTLKGFADATGCPSPDFGIQAAATSQVTC